MANPNKALEDHKTRKYVAVRDLPASSCLEAEKLANELRAEGEFDRVRVNSRVQGRGVRRSRAWRVTGYVKV